MEYILGIIIAIIIAGLMLVMYKQQVLMNERLGVTDHQRIEQAVQARVLTWLDGLAVGRDIERVANGLEVAKKAEAQPGEQVPDGEDEPDDGVEDL